MYFTPNETQQRHAFIDHSLEAANAVLAEPQIVEALGDYAADLSDVAGRLYIPNARFGRLTVPRAYRGTDHIPVVALETGERLRVYDDEFKERNPRQREAVFSEVESWGTPYDPVVYAQNLGSIATARCKIYPRQQLITSLAASNLAAVSDVRAHVDIPTAALRSPDVANRYLVRARPLLTLNYSKKQADPGVVVHEYAHIVQSEREVVIAAPEDNEAMHDARWELEAYHVGATLVHAMRGAGMEIADYGKQVKRDRIRQTQAAQDDPFRPTAELLGNLAQQKLGI